MRDAAPRTDRFSGSGCATTLYCTRSAATCQILCIGLATDITIKPVADDRIRLARYNSGRSEQ